MMSNCSCIVQINSTGNSFSLQKFLLNLFLISICSTGFANLKAQFISAEVAIDGFTCSMCALGVEKSIRQLDFVDDVKMDLNKSIAVVQFKKNKEVSIHSIAAKILDAGFSVRYINANYNFPEVSVANYSIYKNGNDEFHFLDINPGSIKGPTNIIFVNHKFSSKISYSHWQRWIKEDLKRNGKKEKVYYVTLFHA